MSTIQELFAPRFMTDGSLILTPEIEAHMAKELGADSLRYLPMESVARSIDLPSESLCQACINNDYPTPAGKALYEQALVSLTDPSTWGKNGPERTYDRSVEVSATRT
jgi:amidophosphoribosyltransferase